MFTHSRFLSMLPLTSLHVCSSPASVSASNRTARAIGLLFRLQPTSLNTMLSNKSRRKHAGQASKDVMLTEESGKVLLLIAALAVDGDLLSGCPAPVLQAEPTEVEYMQQKQLHLHMESWVQLAGLLSWFVEAALAIDPQAKLRFATCLSKECRADVHKLVQKKHSKVCESVSEGFGSERRVAVIAKGAGDKQRLTSEQMDHALALWYMHKQQRKHQQKQQQQPQQGVIVRIQEQCLHEQCQEQHEGSVNMQTAAAGAELASREYSRDEVAQMLVQGKLTVELSTLWSSAAAEAQRQVRLLCLEASAGDAQAVQGIITAHPELVSSGVVDLSSGGQLPLHLAAAAGEVEVLRLLLDAGADVKAVNGNGETALQVAQRCEQCDCEAVLLQAGAVNTKQDNWEHFSSGL